MLLAMVCCKPYCLQGPLVLLRSKKLKYLSNTGMCSEHLLTSVCMSCCVQGPLVLPLSKKLKYLGNNELTQDYLQSTVCCMACCLQGPLVLPLSEKLKYLGNTALRKAAKRNKSLATAVPSTWLKPYTPDFTRAFDFFCIHTGGRGIIDGLEKEMQLSREAVEPSRASLYRFGNTSSTR